MPKIEKIGLGGGCHWCTEGVFNQIIGVTEVKQGYIKATEPNDYWSEAILVSFDPKAVTLNQLIAIHLRSHAATATHSMRRKYRSAVYYLNEKDQKPVNDILKREQKNFDGKLITKSLKYEEFKESRKSLRDYYGRNPDAPFCKRYIVPKLTKLKAGFKPLIKPGL